MKTNFSTTTSRNPVLVRSKRRMPKVANAIIGNRPKEHYYSIIVPAENDTSPYVSVTVNVRKNVLRINLVSMAIYECYLFALGLPSNFPKEQVIIQGLDRPKCIPCRSCYYGGKFIYDCEFTVPINSTVEQYQQYIFDNLNEYFQLDVRIEKLSVVQGSRPIMTMESESVELIWHEQQTVIIKFRKNNNK
ncbi:hypothetical protein [Sphingobacterium sp. IITKGP-BTPF85]|uniref:hypothetical protein n=1 Tax=Sphingobacterium sp. IITKGP-BTPF85 TaxID=1338009 RepID=UPI0012E03632|nr:hypothetical protein [Sphingobacterium sp. IITKGP-BTPF85]